MSKARVTYNDKRNIVKRRALIKIFAIDGWEPVGIGAGVLQDIAWGERTNEIITDVCIGPCHKTIWVKVSNDEAFADTPIKTHDKNQETIKALTEALVEIGEIEEQYSDIDDGTDGQPTPNSSMQVMIIVDEALKKAGDA